MEEKIYIITPENNNIRLDKAVSILDNDLSRMAVQRMIEEENILVNDKKEKVSYKVKTGDAIRVIKENPKESTMKAENIPLDVIYEDKDILIVNKAKGMVVHPGNGNLDGTLANAVMARCKDSLSGIGGEIRPGIVHRIDKDTSGILIVAKNDKAHINVSEQIKNHTVKKTYVALVRGRIKENKYMTLFIITLCLTFVLLIIAFVYSSSIKLVLPNPNGPVYTGIKAHLISEHHCFVKIVLGLSFCSFGFSIFFLFYKFKEGKRKKNG